jgi:hypothetical protein
MVRIGPKLVGGRRGGREQTYYANARRLQDPVAGARAALRNYERSIKPAITIGGSSAGVSDTTGISTGSNALRFHHFYVKGTGTEDGFTTGHFCDGSRVAFTLENAAGEVSPVEHSSVVSINGQVYREGATLDYTISGAVITFAIAPRAGAELYGSCAIEEITT